MLDNKNTIAGADKVTDVDEGYEAIGPSKVVQYAPTVQDKASKAFAGHEKVNFGDIDSKRAAITPGQAVSGNAAFNPPPGFADQRSLFAAQNPEVRLPPRQIQPPPGIPLPPGLPIPASYYQQQGIAPPTGPGNTPFAQPRETAGPPVQTIDNRQAGPGQYRPAYLDMGPFTVGQRSDANDSYLNLNITDAEIKTLNETFAKYGQTKEGIHLLTDRYGRRGAVSEQGSASKGGESAGGPSKPKTIEKDNFKERFEEVFGTKGKVSIQVLQEHQKKRLIAERIRNEMIAAENEKKVPEPVTGNTELFPYPTHGKSDSEVSRELLVGVMKQLSSYVEDEGVTKDVAANKSVYKAGPWKKPPAGKIPDWIGDDNTSFFDQSFGKDYVPEGRQTTGGGGPSNQPVKDAVKLEQTAAKGDGGCNTGGSGNQSVGKYDAAKGEQSVGQGQASNTPGNVIFGPPKPPGYPNHMPPREYLRPLKTFEPFENEPPKVRYGLLPANPRSTNTAEKSYINYRGGAVGPIADSAPRYVYGPKGYLELAKDTAPPPPVDPSPFKQPTATPSPYAALEQALGTTRFTQGVAEHNRLKTPIPPPGAKPTGGLITDVINGFTRVNYGGRQTQLDPDGSGLSRSEVLKRNQRPGERIGINFYGPNGMEFEIDKTDFNPAEHNTLGGKFKLKSQLRREEEALRAQQSQQPKQTSFEGAQQATPAKGTPVQGKGSGEGSGTRSFSNTPSGGNPQPGPATPGNRGAQGNPEPPKRGGKGWHGGMGGRQ
ncbi:hypothetical protein HOY82DRAFT_584605 [Tuber indicum]|nr:hypothetical protein HOY82DRAFT_584605 [Tuber indicum]